MCFLRKALSQTWDEIKQKWANTTSRTLLWMMEWRMGGKVKNQSSVMAEIIEGTEFPHITCTDIVSCSDSFFCFCVWPEKAFLCS